MLIGFSMKVDKSLSHSFEETYVDQTGLDESDSNLSSFVWVELSWFPFYCGTKFLTHAYIIGTCYDIFPSLLVMETENQLSH